MLPPYDPEQRHMLGIVLMNAYKFYFENGPPPLAMESVSVSIWIGGRGMKVDRVCFIKSRLCVDVY